MLEPRRPNSLRYVVAVLAVLAAVALLQVPAVGQGIGTPIPVFFFAILGSAWYGGLRGGLLTTLLIAVATLPPSLPLWRVIRLALFIAGGTTIGALLEALHSARWNAETSAAESRKNEKRLQQLIESITDYAVFTTDAEGRVASWNLGAERTLGFAADDIVGSKVTVFASPSDISGAGLELEPELMRGGESVRADLSCIRKDGSRFLASASISPLGQNGANGTTWVLRDITERQRTEDEMRQTQAELERRVEERTAELVGANEALRSEIDDRGRAEEALRASEERFRLLVESVKDYAILMLDPEGRVTSWNTGA